MRLAGLLLGVALSAATADAQSAIRIRVIDPLGVPVPFANVSVNGGLVAITDSLGVAPVRTQKRDSIELRVRRIGYKEFFGFVRNDSLGELSLTLTPLARLLAEVRIEDRQNTTLSRTGFYNRAERVRNGAILGEFLTPELLDERNAASVSRALSGQRYVTVGRMGSRPVLLGRGGCAMTVLLDGQRLAGQLEEAIVEETPTSINRSGTATRNAGRPDLLFDIDQVVSGLSVMAIEIYPSTANAPFELQRLGGRGSCGIIAIWTGPRG